MYWVLLPYRYYVLFLYWLGVRELPRARLHLYMTGAKPAGPARFPQRVHWKTEVADFMVTLPVDAGTKNARVSYKDAKGNAAKVDGTPAWSTSNPDILTVEPSVDGFACKVTVVGAVGTAQVKVEADADLGAGVKSLVTLLDVEVIPGEAVAGQIDLTD